MLCYDERDPSGPIWAPAEFRFRLKLTWIPAECRFREDAASYMVQRLDTGKYVWVPATHVRQWIPQASWRKLRGQYNVEFVVGTPGAETTDEGTPAAGATRDRGYTRQWISQWRHDRVARHQAWKGQSGWKMEKAAQEKRWRAFTRKKAEQAGSSSATMGAPAGSVVRMTNDHKTKNVESTIKQEPMEFIGYVGDFGLDLKPDSK